MRCVQSRVATILYRWLGISLRSPAIVLPIKYSIRLPHPRVQLYLPIYSHMWPYSDLRPYNPALLPIMLANAAIIYYCNQIFFVWAYLQVQKSFMLCWRSFLGRGKKHVACLCTYTDGWYFHIGRMWLCSSLIVESVRQNFVDTPSPLTIKADKQ